MKRVDITGQRFGKLTVIESAGSIVSKDKRCVVALWKCLCDCGATTVVRGALLKNGHTKSCGWCQKIVDCGDHMQCITANGLTFIFDRGDFDLVNAHRWSINSDGYVETNNDEFRGLLHRLIMNADKSDCVDHINGIPSDCRRSNLRIVTFCENSRNMKTPKRNTTGYKGVSYDGWSKRKKKYRASIRVFGKTKSLGYYLTREEAATAYNKAAAFHFGEYARLNVLGQPYTTISAAI